MWFFATIICKCKLWAQSNTYWSQQKKVLLIAAGSRISPIKVQLPKKKILNECYLDLQIIVDSKVLKFQVLKIRGKIELYLRIRINNCQPNGLTALYYCCVSNWFWITHIIIYNNFAIHPVSLWAHVSNSNKRRKEKGRWIFHALMMCGVDALVSFHRT